MRSDAHTCMYWRRKGATSITERPDILNSPGALLHVVDTLDVAQLVLIASLNAKNFGQETFPAKE